MSMMREGSGLAGLLSGDWEYRVMGERRRVARIRPSARLLFIGVFNVVVEGARGSKVIA